MATGATRKQKPRRNVAKGLRRLGQFALASVFGLGGCALVFWAGWQLMSLPVERVIVTGEMREVSREQLAARVNDSLEGGFLMVDLRRIRDSLESLPWVYRVVIKRRWPNSLEIQVSEQLPIARWGNAGYLNHAGDLFVPEQAADSGTADLPRLSGPQDSQQEVMARYKIVQDGLRELGLRVMALTMDARGSLQAQLAGGEQLVLGRDNTAQRVERFGLLYQKELAPGQRQLARVDLRYSNGAAVAWAVASDNDKKQDS